MKRARMLNLMNVTDPKVPFALVKDTLRQADVLFGNLEWITRRCAKLGTTLTISGNEMVVGTTPSTAQ